MTATHGTPSAYFNGCGCPACKTAGARVRTEGTHAAYLAGKTHTPPLFYPWDRTTPFDSNDPRHGGLSAYTLGCRCPWCREAGKVYREYKKQGLKLPKHFNVRNQEGE